MERRERPQCRKAIERLLVEKRCSLEDLILEDNKFKISDAMRIQVRKMIEERAS